MDLQKLRVVLFANTEVITKAPTADVTTMAAGKEIAVARLARLDDVAAVVLRSQHLCHDTTLAPMSV